MRYKDGLAPIVNVPFQKEYRVPCGASIVRIYRYGDLPKECLGLELLRKKGATQTLEEITLDFPEREIMVNAKGSAAGDGTFIDIPEYVQSNIFSSPYFTGITELADGTLAAGRARANACCIRPSVRGRVFGGIRGRRKNVAQAKPYCQRARNAVRLLRRRR